MTRHTAGDPPRDPPTGPLSVRAAARLLSMHHSTLQAHIKNGSVRSHEAGRVVYMAEVVEDLAANIDLTKAHRRGAKGRRKPHAARPAGEYLPGSAFAAEDDLEHWADVVAAALKRPGSTVAPDGFGIRIARADAVKLLEVLRGGPDNAGAALAMLMGLGIQELPVVRVRRSEVEAALAAGLLTTH